MPEQDKSIDEYLEDIQKAPLTLAADPAPIGDIFIPPGEDVYHIDWSKVQTIEDIKDILKPLCITFHVPKGMPLQVSQHAHLAHFLVKGGE